MSARLPLQAQAARTTRPGRSEALVVWTAQEVFAVAIQSLNGIHFAEDDATALGHAGYRPR